MSNFWKRLGRISFVLLFFVPFAICQIFDIHITLSPSKTGQLITELILSPLIMFMTMLIFAVFTACLGGMGYWVWEGGPSNIPGPPGR